MKVPIEHGERGKEGIWSHFPLVRILNEHEDTGTTHPSSTSPIFPTNRSYHLSTRRRGEGDGDGTLYTGAPRSSVHSGACKVSFMWLSKYDYRRRQRETWCKIRTRTLCVLIRSYNLVHFANLKMKHNWIYFCVWRFRLLSRKVS